MVVTNVNQLKAALDKACAEATLKIELYIHDVVDAYIKKFYIEWVPGPPLPDGPTNKKYINHYGYQRMHQLIKSLIKTDVAKTANGYEAKVYLDFSKMNHDFNYVNGQKIRHKHWPEETIGRVAAETNYPHGGWERGTTIWVDPIEELNGDKRELLKRMIIEAGIPVK